MEIKPSERDFLLDVSTYGVFEHPALLRNRYDLRALDWAYVLGQLLVHRLVPLAYSALAHEDSLTELPRAITQWLRRLYFPNKIQQKLLTATAGEVTRHLAENNVPHCYLKGPILQADYYPPWSRPYNDLDLLVDPADLSRVTDLLCSLGFTQGWIRGDVVAPPTREEMIAARLTSHEMVPFCRETGSDAVPHINIDVQFELPGTKPFGLRGTVNEMLRLCRSKTNSGLEIPNPVPEWHLVLLCTHQQMHFRVEDEIRNANDLLLIRLSDLLRVTSAMANTELWDEFVRIATHVGALDLVQECFRIAAVVYGPRMMSLIPSAFRVICEPTHSRSQRQSDDPAAVSASVRDWVFDIGARLRAADAGEETKGESPLHEQS